MGNTSENIGGRGVQTHGPHPLDPRMFMEYSLLSKNSKLIKPLSLVTPTLTLFPFTLTKQNLEE
jgi:hypothetical protein